MHSAEPLGRLPSCGYRDANGQLVAKVDRRGDVHLHVG
jgi:hypothetical protein